MTLVSASYPLLLGSVYRVLVPSATGAAAVTNNIAITVPFTVGFTMMVVGATIRKISFRQLGRNFTFELAVRKEHRLVTTGLYSLVRHPAYVGLLIFLYGAAISQMGSGSYWRVSGMEKSIIGQVFSLVYWSCLVYVSVVAVIRTREEDAVLRDEFREQWDAWAAKTRYRLIPRIY